MWGFIALFIIISSAFYVGRHWDEWEEEDEKWKELYKDY